MNQRGIVQRAWLSSPLLSNSCLGDSYAQTLGNPARPSKGYMVPLHISLSYSLVMETEVASNYPLLQATLQ